MISIKKIKLAFSLKPQYKSRFEKDFELCPFCGLNEPFIYDQNHDACSSCHTKWEISKELQDKHKLSFSQKIKKIFD